MKVLEWLFGPAPPPVPPAFRAPIRFGERVKVAHGFYGGVEGLAVGYKERDRLVGSMWIKVDTFRVQLTVPSAGMVEEWFERWELERLA